MGWPTVEAAVARLWASPERDVRLLLTGGEPLVDFAFVRRVIEHARATKPRGSTLALDLLTNGTRLGDEEIGFFARHRVAVQISLDGVEPAQRLRGAWTFSRLDALVATLRARHRTWFRNRVNAAVTLVPETIPHLAESIDYLLGRGFTDITLSPATGNIRGWRDALLPLLDAQFGLVYRSSLSHYRRTGLVPLSLFRKAKPSPHPPWSARCGVDDGHVAVVDVDGHVYGCPPLVGSALDRPEGLLRAASHAMRIGHVSDPGLGGSLTAYRHALEATGLFGPRDACYSSHGKCRDCTFLGYCDVCPLAIALAPGASDPVRVPDFICAYNRVSLKYRHRFPRQRSA
jgi:sulfatase maturation enzyme AslB (radical SAM superfamily)